MRGSPRQIQDVKDIVGIIENFNSIWRDAQQIDHFISTSAPLATEGRNGEMRVGVVDGVGKIFIKLNGAWFQISLTAV